MRRLIIILIGCVVCWLVPPNSHGQGVITYSCWFDEDYSTLQTGLMSNNQITLNVDMLSEGFHSVNVQFGTDSNAQIQRHLFYRAATVTNPMHANTYSCWFDENYSTLQTGSIGNGIFMVDVSELDEGFHSVNVQYGTGANAQLSRHFFFRVPTTAATAHATTYSCWFDEDYSTLQTGSIGNGIFMVDVSELDEGFHSVNVQYGTGANAQLSRHFFFRVPTTTATAHATTYSCWFDEDYSTLQTGSIGNGIFMLNVDSLSDGFHSVNVQYGTGTHAQLGRFLFYKVPSAVAPSDPITYSCWFDQVDNIKQSGTVGSDGIITLDVSSLSDSNHTVYLQFGDGDNAQLSSHLFWKQAVYQIQYGETAYGTITIPNSSDTVIDGHYVFDSTIITITATPNPYYTLQFLIVNGDTVTAPYTMLVTDNVQVSAVYAAFMPELHVTALGNSDIVAGQEFSASWTVQNDGNASTPVGTTWYDRLYLSSLPYINGNSNDMELLGTWENLSALETGQSYTRNVTVYLPLRHATGPYYLFLLSDAQRATDILTSGTSYSTGLDLTANNNLIEQGELDYYNGSWENTYRHDNFRVKEVQITVPPLADLEVTNIVRPANFYSGTTVNITATVVNNGEAATRSEGWFDVLFISTSDTFDASAHQLDAVWHSATGISTLSPNGSYQVTFSGDVPLSMYGTAYFYVITNADNGEYEHIGSSNNMMRSQPANIILTPPADLVVSDLAAPSSISNKASFTVNYTVHNVGLGNPDHNNWVDKVYLSSTQTLADDGYHQLLETISHNDGLEAGHSYTIQRSYQLPSSIQESQTLYTIVVTDAEENVFEYLSENNNTVTSNAMSVTIYKPDFSLTNATLPDTIVSGHSINLAVTLHNIGQMSYQGNLQYNVYYSTNDEFNPSTAFLLDSPWQYSDINTGAEHHINLTLSFPSNFTDGNYYIFVAVNPNNIIPEENLQNNNVSTGLINLCHRPLPDLVLLNLRLPDTVYAGQKTLLEFDVINAGETTELGSADLYSVNFNSALYANSSWSPVNSQIQPSSLGTLSISVGDTAHFLQYVTIPPTLNSGNISFSLYIDANNSIQELNESNNFAFFSRHVIALPFDLAVSGITAPTTYTTGDTIQLEWTVSVQDRQDVFRHSRRTITDTTGFAGYINWIKPDNNSYAWGDRIYLSCDSVLSSDDIALGSASIKLRHLNDSGYTVRLTSVMPHSLSGNLYLLAVADTGFSIIEHNRDNNIFVYPVTASLAPLPNLQITELTMEDTVSQRQGCLVRYTVVNTGEGDIVNAMWSDAFFFGGIRLTTISHQGSLASGESYTDSVEIVVPDNLLGAYAFRGYVDVNNDIFEDTHENDNSLAQPIVVIEATPCDLIVSTVDAPQQAVVGGQINVSWSVQNIGEYSVNGRIKDGIYLSTDTIFDNGDVMIGEYSYQTSLDVYSSIQRTMECNVNGVISGDYYVIVRTNIMNAFSEVTFTNNRRASINIVEITLPSLTIGQPEQMLLSSGTEAYYRMAVGPEYVGKTLSVTLTSDSVIYTGARFLVSTGIEMEFVGNMPSLDGTYMNSLFLSHETMPTSAQFDYGSSIPFTKELRVMIPVLQQGNYYIKATANTSQGFIQQMTLLAEIVDFEILTVDANSGSNTGSVTTKIVGAKFDTIMDFRLTKDNDYLPAEKVKFTNTNEVYATFNLVDIPIGVYNMQAELPGGIVTQKDGVFTVEQGLPSELQINILAPSDVRVGNTAVFSIEYGNNGTTDLNISGFLVTSPNGYPIALSATELDNAADSVIFYTGEFGMDPDIIRPGYFGTKNIYVRANTAGTISIYVYAIRRQYE